MVSNWVKKLLLLDYNVVLMFFLIDIATISGIRSKMMASARFSGE